MIYKGSPTYAVFTTADPITMIFDLHMYMFGGFSGGPATVLLKQILRNAGTLYSLNWISKVDNRCKCSLSQYIYCSSFQKRVLKAHEYWQHK